MTTFEELACARRSIRKYAPDPVRPEDLAALLRAAQAAPSACGAQNWLFVVLQGRRDIEGLARAVEAGVRRAHREFLPEAEESYVEGRVRHSTFFRSAPLVLAVYMRPVAYADARLEAAMRGAGLSYEAEMERLARPDILGLGAAIENLLLCAQDLGYGGCWMNAPALAAPEIDEYLGKAGESLRLMSLVPIGRPAYTPREKPLRPDAVEFRANEEA